MTEMWIPASMGKLYGVLELPEKPTPVPLVILSHGFGGNHEGHMDYAAAWVARGFATFSLDFCGGGLISRSDGTMTDMSVLTEAEDLNAVIDTFKADHRFSGIFLFGASQGGFVSSYVAAGRPEDVAALVLEYPAFVLQDDAKKRALPDGTFPEQDAVMGRPIGHRYSEDAVSFDIYDVIGGYKSDVLITHGTADAIVPIRYSERAASIYEHAELMVFPGQGHGYTSEGRSKAIKAVGDFLQAHAT